MDNPQLPYDEQAERRVLVAMLKDSTAFALVAESLQHGDFFDERRGYIFHAAARLVNANRIITEHTLCEQLAADGRLDMVGGKEIIHRIATHPDGQPNEIEEYAATVIANSQRRAMIQAAERQIQAAADLTRPIDEVIEEAEAKMIEIATRARDEDFTSIGQEASDYLTLLDRLQNSGSKISGIPTALPSLDDITSGWQDQDLIIVAAPPSVGKSSYALLAAKAAAAAGKTVAIFSLEMSKSQLVGRWLAMETGIPTDQMRSANIADSDQMLITRRVAALQSLPVYLNSITGLTTAQIRSKARRLRAKVGSLDFIIVDYIQIIEESKADARRNRAEALGNIAKSLKHMAQYFNCPVMTCAQMSREVFKRSGNLPVLSDLKESGGLEANADIVIFLTRSAVFNPEEADDGTALLHVAKHRNGRTGKVHLHYDRETTLFSEERYSSHNSGGWE